MSEVRLIDANAAADKIMRETEVHADEIGVGGVALMIGFARALHDETSFPTIDAQPVWIPCSERMPENRCVVIFTVDRGHPYVCVGFRINTEREGLKLQRWFDKLSWLNFSDYDVKAWMPMPDAYEETEKE